MLTRLALRARIATIAIMVLVMVAGVYSFSKLPLEMLPDIDFPLITVVTVLPQADAETVLRDVTIPREQAVAGAENVTTVRSTSSPGLSLVMIESAFGKDMKAMERDIAERVSRASLPAGLPPSRVGRINLDELPVLEISVLGERSIYDLNALVTAKVLPELNKVPGVFSADVPLGSGAGLTITRTNGLPSLAISVLKEPDGSTVEVSNAVTARLKSLEAGLPSDVQFVEISNQAPGIQKSINELAQEVVLGSVLAVMVIFAFLLSVRPTFVTSISIPASVLATFIVMAWQGMSLNLLTLGGLAIAVGRVVDDSIVGMENIFRHIQLGDDRWTAALNGTREVTVPIVTSTMTTIAVFAPLGIIGGFIGVIFVPFALTVTYALLASLLVALTVVPVLGSLLIKQGNHRDWQGAWPARTYASLLQWSLTHKGHTLLLAAALFVGSIGVVRFIPVSFFPAMGAPMLRVEVAVPGGASSNDLLQQLEHVEAPLEQERLGGTVNVYQSNIGGSRVFGQGSGRLDTATILVQLPDGTDVETIAAAFRRDLSGQGRTVTVSQASGGGPESNDLELTLRGEDQATLSTSAENITTALQGMSGLINVRNDVATPPAGLGNGSQAPISRVDGQRAVTISGTITARNTGAIQRQVQ